MTRRVLVPLIHFNFFSVVQCRTRCTDSTCDLVFSKINRMYLLVRVFVARFCDSRRNNSSRLRKHCVFFKPYTRIVTIIYK